MSEETVQHLPQTLSISPIARQIEEQRGLAAQAAREKLERIAGKRSVLLRMRHQNDLMRGELAQRNGVYYRPVLNSAAVGGVLGLTPLGD